MARIYNNLNFCTLDGLHGKMGKDIVVLPLWARGAIIFTTFHVDLEIAYKEIAESLCSRHNVVT